MDGKPIYYDGSMKPSNIDSTLDVPFKLNDDTRVNICGNPYRNEKEE